jgi:hypothetical protein
VRALKNLVFGEPLQQFFLSHGNTLSKGLHKCFTEAIFPAVRSLIVVGVHPAVQIGLQFSYAAIYLFTKGNRIKLILIGGILNMLPVGGGIVAIALPVLIATVTSDGFST